MTDAQGRPLDAPLAVEPDVSWVGYANAAIRAQVEPLLQQALGDGGCCEFRLRVQASGLVGSRAVPPCECGSRPRCGRAAQGLSSHIPPMLNGTASFLDLLQTLDHHPFEPARGLFDPGSDVVIARAPGRLDVMGGIADYSGSLVLQWPIREATFAAVQPTPRTTLRIVSLSDTGAPRACAVPLDAIAAGGRAGLLRRCKAWFAADAARHWAAYVAGAWAGPRARAEPGADEAPACSSIPPCRKGRASARRRRSRRQ